MTAWIWPEVGISTLVSSDWPPISTLSVWAPAPFGERSACPEAVFCVTVVPSAAVSVTVASPGPATVT